MIYIQLLIAVKYNFIKIFKTHREINLEWWSINKFVRITIYECPSPAPSPKPFFMKTYKKLTN